MKEEQDSVKIEKDHCVFCEKYFSSNDAMKEHILKDHKMKSFPCPNEECDRTFTEKKRMLEHVHELVKLHDEEIRISIPFKKRHINVGGLYL